MANFGYFKNICRGCGFCFCNGCCNLQAKIPDFGYNEPVKVCRKCHRKYASADERLKYLEADIADMERRSARITADSHILEQTNNEELTKYDNTVKAMDEEFMQQMLKLDGLVVSTELRAKKKQVIVRIQEHIKQLDALVERIIDRKRQLSDIIVRNSPLKSPYKYDPKQGLRVFVV